MPNNFKIEGLSGAAFSNDRRYRWLLWRAFTIKPPSKWLMVVGLNPSKAAEQRNDPTVSQMVGRAQRLGFEGLLMLNSHAYVATDPLGMKLVRDPVGEENMAYIEFAAGLADTILCAWGNLAGEQGKRVEVVLRASGKPLVVLGTTGSGNPRHPRGVSLSVQPVEWLAQ